MKCGKHLFPDEGLTCWWCMNPSEGPKPPEVGAFMTQEEIEISIREKKRLARLKRQERKRNKENLELL